MKSISTALTLFVAASLPHSNVLAYPNGAGTCGSGDAISTGHPGTGITFAEYNLVLLWGGAELSSSGTNTIAAGTDHTITLTGSSKFKGFSLRLSGKNGATTSSTVFVAADSSLAQLNDLCASGVIGITHKDDIGKSGVTVTLNHPEAAELLLEVTVVTTNRANWAYEAFDLSVSADARATASPTASPNQSGSATLVVSNVMMLGALFLASFAMM